jgi:predicted amidohydrolase YtcJ
VPARAPDAIVVGRVITLAGHHGLGAVDAIAIHAGRVVATGGRRDVEALAGRRTRKIELGPDELALPGLTDSHLHLAEAALAVDQVQLADAATLAQGLDRIRAAHLAQAPGDWLTGNGWSADRWGGWPTAAQLEVVAPGRLVALWAHDHHALWVSYPALALAGVGPAGGDPPGGAIRRDAAGSPTGILQESATGLVSVQVPAPSATTYEAALPRICRELVALGVVAVHDPGLLRPDPRLDGPHAAYAALADAGALPILVFASIRTEALGIATERGLRSGDHLGRDAHGRARLGWLKLFADGSLGSRTAAMLAPFEPPDGSAVDLEDTGIWVTDPGRLAELAAEAAAAGIATQIHGIGDAAVRAALDAFEPTATRGLPVRARIEHAQLVDPIDATRFGELGVVASIQPVHLRADASQARRSWGRRAERSGYAWRSLLETGASLAFGTDAPVEPIDPWPGIALSITRRSTEWPAGTPAFGPGEALTLDEALRAACLGPAEAEGSVERGRLTAGQRADLVVIPAEAIAEPIVAGGPLATVRPRIVMIGGAVVFET